MRGLPHVLRQPLPVSLLQEAIDQRSRCGREMAMRRVDEGEGTRPAAQFRKKLDQASPRQTIAHDEVIGLTYAKARLCQGYGAEHIILDMDRTVRHPVDVIPIDPEQPRPGTAGSRHAGTYVP